MTLTRTSPHAQASTQASIVDVARRAGVSASTVSRSLRGTPNVARETRDRVLRAASELAYVPSPAASRLASGRTRAIGVIVAFAARWFFSEVVGGAEKVLRDAGYDLLLYNVGDPTSRSHFFETMPLRRRVDAVLIIASSFDPGERAALHALGVPISLVQGELPGAPRVGIDDEAGAATAARHLISLGHRDIAMISADPDDPIGRATTLARRAGFRRALREAGLDDTLIVSQPWGVTGGIRAMEDLLGRDRLPTGVFAESDEMALGALQTLRRARLDVPGLMSVVGFDDHEMAPIGDLTTIAQPVQAQGELGARALLDSLDGRADLSADVTLNTRLVVRGSTGPPPSRREASPPGSGARARVTP